MNQEHASTKARVVEFKYNWSIENFSFFSAEPGVPVMSLPFAIPGTESNWCFKLYPGGISPESDGHVSVFLKLLKPKTPEVVAKFKLYLEKNNNFVGDSLETGVHNFSQEEYGFTKVIKRDVLVQRKSGLLLDDNLVIICEIMLSLGLIDNRFDNQVSISRHANKCRANFVNHMYDIYLKQLFADVTLLVDGKEFLAHKAILAGRSPLFADFFINNPTKTEFELDDIDCDVMEEVLRYLYSGKVLVNNFVMAIKIFEAANVYMFCDYNLERVCEALLIAEIDASNAADLLIFADNSLENLQQAAIKYIIGNCGEVMSTQKYKDFEALLRSAASSEHACFVNWVSRSEL
ncbi:hypothetical protein TSAR_004972 [Trichomalopsis sarcophagae]|uniref:BTB domain-containing protein n=1 Tax=Trichomalopsis sarcophagae TaxID=543379 RepID=A0A232EL09_9HYME|nr:hypothetical protein TSAR_004972 [Trichomalopsis sarcophagae]